MHDWPTLAEASGWIASRAISSLELARLCLDRISNHDAALNTFITVTADRALDDARKADASGSSDPLRGIPIGLKDIIDTAGLLTTCASRWNETNIPEANAECAGALADAGTVLLGKLTTYEFAGGGPDFDLPWPAARNPWDTSRATAGSSSGSAAAVAAGFVLGAIGSDTGGSIRAPAALCGIAGMKPSYGLVSMKGVAPVAPTLDHVGPMAWTAEDCAMLLDGLVRQKTGKPRGYRDQVQTSVKNLRIGVVSHFHDHDHPVGAVTRGAISDAADTFRALGASVREVRLPPLADWYACGTVIAIAERFALYKERLFSDANRFGQRHRDRLLTSLLLSQADYDASMRVRGQLCCEFSNVMHDVDILLTASEPEEARNILEVPRWDSFEAGNFHIPANVTGAPAISVCAGFGPQGLPLAIQLIGRPMEDLTVLRAAHAYESEHGWRSRRPALVSSGCLPEPIANCPREEELDHDNR